MGHVTYNKLINLMNNIKLFKYEGQYYTQLTCKVTDMKITKQQLKKLIKEELESVMQDDEPGQAPENDVSQLIEQGRSFFDQVIALSMASENDTSAAEKLNAIEQALSREVHERSNGYVRFTIIG